MIFDKGTKLFNGKRAIVSTDDAEETTTPTKIHPVFIFYISLYLIPDIKINSKVVKVFAKTILKIVF